MDLQISAYLFKSSILSHWISGQLLALGTWVKNKTIDEKPLSSIILQDKNLELILFISQKNRTTQQYTAIEIISIFFSLFRLPGQYSLPKKQKWRVSQVAWICSGKLWWLGRHMEMVNVVPWLCWCWQEKFEHVGFYLKIVYGCLYNTFSTELSRN